MPKIKLQGQLVHYTIRKSKRARRVSLKIDSRGLEVVIPHGARQRDLNIDDMLREKARWILKYLDKHQPTNGAGRQYNEGETIPYLGREYTLRVLPKANGQRVSVRLEGDSIQIRLPKSISDSEQSEVVRESLASWYHQQARQYILRRTAELAAQYTFEYGRITIRDQKTRWGSCSAQSNLNFNRRLMMAPPEAIDYVIIHELCHLKEMNHSKRFWSLVARYCPDYKIWRKWLKDNTAYLQW